MNNFYSGEKLLNTLDINGKRPEIYIVESNRSAGKTTYFAKKLIDNFLKNNEKFIIIYRWAYEIKNCADSFFGSVNSLFYPASQMTQRTVEGKYAEMIDLAQSISKQIAAWEKYVKQQGSKMVEK